MPNEERDASYSILVHSGSEHEDKKSNNQYSECKMCIELGFLQTNQTIMCEDCQAAVALSMENKFRNRSKHISLRWSFVVERQSLAIGDITVVGISRTGMLADIFCLPPTTSQNIWFGSEFNRCLIAPLKCVHLKKTKSNVVSAETKQTLLPNVIIGCYAKSMKICVPNQNKKVTNLSEFFVRFRIQ